MKSSLIKVDFRWPKCKSSCLLRYPLLLFPLYFPLLNAYNTCTVSNQWVQFRGVVRSSILAPDYKYCGYLGIPYAQPPVGALRFRNPIPLEPLTGVYNATSDGNVCPQNDPVDKKLKGNEDCLYLNVYTPKVLEQRPTHLLPVIVYIHGGGFYVGSGSSKEVSPDYIIRYGVIFVTLNHRLNIFGFLNLGIPECAGNQGLRDQVVALEWVQNNIRSFGGDPNSVTLMGQSAGGMSAYLLALSPLARGLFHKVIIMSTMLPNWVSREMEPYSIKVAQLLGYNGNAGNRPEILQYLQTLDTRQVLSSVVNATLNEESNRTDTRCSAISVRFSPSPDAYLGHDALLPSSLEELGKQTRDIPILMGQTTADGALFCPTNLEEIAFIEKCIIVYLDPVYIGDKRIENEVVAKVREYYFGRHNNENQFNQAVQFLQDVFYFNFYQQTRVFEASLRNHKIYQYLFSYDGSFQFYKKLFVGEPFYRNVSGVAHTEELSYLFYVQRNPVFTLTNDDYKIIHQMSTWWTNFAKTGNPNADYNCTGEGWGPVTPQEPNYFRIDRESYFIKGRINEERWQFWDSLPRSAPFPFEYPIESFSSINRYN